MMIVASGDSLKNSPVIEWENLCALTTVLAAQGYPDSVETGDAIRLPAPPHGIHVFHGSTSRDNATDQLVTSGGRVLAITGTGRTIEEAAKCSQSYAEKISFDGKQFRRDIGRRELERHAGAS